ncbi:helix-turn-helix domain-containing protein [Cyanobium sp. CH-040]|uniref:helix-turn-helix domain-containing protein n=1 Tax=Cyanobium sp. CH-040 TaxID=2823708 RepID=UPI0020CDA0DE|nr:AraC family transcriptional regulator [Cyanobium sp. CH-040]MCP9929073.1 helix-turn-helix transcriptional regulator [Cyanobium sp. CH-040]
MTFTFEDGELRHLLREHVQQTQPELISSGTDQTLTFPDWLGTGHKRDIELPSGISLTIHQYRLKEDIICRYKAGASDCVEFIFGLSYRTSYNRSQNYQSRQLFIAPACCEPGLWTEYAEQDCLAVDIHIDLSVLRGLVGQADDSLPADLARLLVGDTPLMPTSPVRMSRSIHLSLQQMLCCPYQGVTRTLYLEAKSLELLSLFIDATQESPLVSPALSRDDRERIYQAQQLLVDNLQTPPSLIALARQVGLNDRKLKEGFRQVFDTTVFGFLTQHRLERARHLLAQEYSIAAVSAAVGYASPTAFSGAFRRRFGVSPKAYQIGQRCVA